MAIFYRGAGIGTYWHDHNARDSGFVAKNTRLHSTVDRLIQHVARGNFESPYVSLTRSYGVAYAYARSGRTAPSEESRAYVYELEIDAPSSLALAILDPIKEIAREAPNPLDLNSYQHDGDTEFLLGVVNPKTNREFLSRPVLRPPASSSGTPRPANLSLILETLVLALRDAELLAVGHIPAGYVRARHEVW